MNCENKKQTKDSNHVFRVGDLIENPKKNMIYRPLELIGKGSFGQVFLVQACNKSQSNSYHNINMAMKIFKKQPAYINQGLIQIKNLREIAKFEQTSEGSRKNYLNLYDAFMWQGYLCIAMELLDNSILNILQSSGYKGLQMKWIQKWTKEILLFLAKIHAIGIIHCDIKPENIMFRPQEPQKPLFIDFSSSCTKDSQLFTYIQSRFYRSPEVLIGLKPYSQKIDIWSLGCMLAEMYLGLPLFPGGSAYDQISKIYHLIRNRFSLQSEGQMINSSEHGFKFFEVKEVKVQKQIEEKEINFNRKREVLQISEEEQMFPKESLQIRLKTIQQYEQQSGQKVQVNQDYFSLKCIEDMTIIRNPPAKDVQTHELFIDLLKKMLVFNPEERISAESAFLHPFIGGIFSDLEQIRTWEMLYEKQKEQKQRKQGQSK